jgi:hypothetical protein
MIDYNNGFAVVALFDINLISPNVLPASMLTLIADSLFICFFPACTQIEIAQVTSCELRKKCQLIKKRKIIKKLLVVFLVR